MRLYIKILAFALIACALLTGCRQLEGGENIGPSETEKTIEVKYPDPDGKKVVCLDAGHGFRDIGCDTPLINGTEADINIAVVMLLKAELEARGIEVILTHDGKDFPSAEEIKALADKRGIEYTEEDIVDNDIFSAYERAIYTSAIAEERGIDLFLSLHVNSIENHPEISRYEMDFCEENPYAAALRFFCRELATDLRKDCEIFEDSFSESFLVTKPMTHPSVLIEMGYATNEGDAEDLNSESWRREFCKTLAENVAEWIASYEEK